MRQDHRRFLPGIQLSGGGLLRILVTGSGGQLGHDVAETLQSRGHSVLAPLRAELDITDSEAVADYFSANLPDAVIHCAAWTAVDLAEDCEEDCRKVNVDATARITGECAKLGIPIVYISTDYVFDGSGDEPWKEDDPLCPINAYGRSKADGEAAVRAYPRHFIVRISWVFGSNGKNFIKTMLNLSKKTDTVRVVDDQFGSPTYTADLAPFLCDMVSTERYGIYHAHNSGVCRWYDVAVETFRAAGLDTKVVPIPTSEFPMKAARPLNSRMDSSGFEAAFGKLPDWKDAVHRFVKSLE